MAAGNNLVMAYLPRESVIHRLTGTTKLVFFLLFSFASMLTYDTRVLLGLAVVSITLFCISKIRVREVAFVFWFMVVFLVLNNVFIYLFAPEQGVKIYGTRHELFRLFWHYTVTTEQLFYHLNITLKYSVSLPIALLFISATNPSEFASSLNRIGVSYHIGYAVALALRYIPDVQRDYHNISQAQQARGIELGRKVSLPTRLKNSVAILFPLILSSIARINTISNAMELRGFGKKDKRTWYIQYPFVLADYLAIGFGVLLLVVSLVITFYDGNRFWNPFV